MITRHSQSVFVAVLFNETLVKEKGGVALAARLFDEDVVSLGKAVKLAGMAQSEFIDHRGALKIPMVRYDKEELERSLADFE